MRLILLASVLSTGVWGQSAAPAQPAAVQKLEGTWRGTLGEGAGKLRLIVTITKSSDGVFSGLLDSVDQSATLAIDKISFQGDDVRLEVNRVGGVYKGALSKDGLEVTGTWAQTGVPPQPLNFKKSESEAAATANKPVSGPKPLSAPIDVTIPIAPTAFRAGGKTHIVYELHITNFGRGDCTLDRIEVRDVAGKPLASYEGAALAANVARPGVDAAGFDRLRVGPGMIAVVYMWVTVDSTVLSFDEILHRVSVKEGEATLTVECGRTPVLPTLPFIGPPLAGDNWLAANGPSNTSLHRRALIPVAGRAQIAQRFAIDWVRIEKDGSGTYHGDPKNNANYRAYGAEVLAVADGVVAEVKDGIPQNVPGLASRAVPITLETVAGNHIMLDLGAGIWAMYAHLQPGSLRVKLGDRVRRGQVLGLVGNSGNSTEPHLHFQLCNANSPLGSEGLPYALASFGLQGTRPDLKPSNTPMEKREMEMPTENEVITFLPEP